MFRFEEFMGRKVLKSSLLDDYNVDAFFTTRDLALKAGEREDLIEEVEQNKKLVCDGLNIPYANLFIPEQTHSDNVGIAKSKMQNAKCFKNTDALITVDTEIAIALNFADCVPLIFYDPVKNIAACAHAGWRGTEAKIGVKTVQKMVECFDSAPQNIIALIGPSIGQCCFDVKDDVNKRLLKSINVVGQFEVPPTSNPPPQGGRESNKSPTYFPNQCCDKNHIDLKILNKIQLLAIGLEKIDVCEYCTSCQTELFYSYRKEKGHTARHSAIIKLDKRSK